ncbi:transglutaminase-like domain-containing protein [Nocardioides pakistanensis]|jgi:hypothetical protein
MVVEVGKADDHLAVAMTPTAGPHLESAFFLDHDSAAVRDFTQQVVAGASTPRERASLLFAAVRDRVWYDPHSVSRDPEHYRASYVLEAGRAYSVPKAGAADRSAAGRGHPCPGGLRRLPQPPADRQLAGPHGWRGPVRVPRVLQRPPRRPMVEGDAGLQWRAVRELRRAPMDFDSFDDLSLDRTLTALDQAYGRMTPGLGVADDTFAAPADTGEATEHAAVNPSVSSD